MYTTLRQHSYRAQCLGKHHYHELCDEVFMSVRTEVTRSSGLTEKIALRIAQFLVGVVAAMAFLRVNEILLGSSCISEGSSQR